MKKTLSLLIAAIMFITVLPCFAEAQFESEKLNALHYVENAVIAQPFEQVQTLHCVLGVENGVNIMYTTSSSKPSTFNVVDLDNMKLLRSFPLPGTASAWEHIIDKDGNVSKNKPSILEKEDFIALQNKIEKVIKQISEEILSGEIAQKPIYMHKNNRTACEFCSYKAICGFDSKMCNNNYNYIPNSPKNEILTCLGTGQK